jgi:hypothetical protein
MYSKVIVAFMLLIAVPRSVLAQNNPKKTDSKTYDLLSSNFSGDTVRGPRTIVASHINVLRYDYKFNNVVTFSAAPDLWSKLSQLASPTTATPATPPKTPAGAAAPLPCSQDLQAKKVLPSLIPVICAADERTLLSTVDKETKGIDAVAGQVAADNVKLGIYVQTANCSTNTVVAGGKALTDFLTTTSGDPLSTTAGIRAQLSDGGGGVPCNGALASSDSTFISGTKAVWVDFQDIAQLTKSEQSLKTELDGYTKSLPRFISDQSAAIATATSALKAISDGIGKGTYTGSTAEVQAAKDEVTSELQNLADSKDNLNLASDELLTASQVNSAILAAVPDLAQGSSKYTSFVQARDQLVTWKARMSNVLEQWTTWSHLSDAQKAVTLDPFSISTLATCEFAFSRTKTTAITLTRTDRMPGSTATNAETVLSVSVECTSPFTVSAGVAFSSIPAHQFALQSTPATPPATGTVNEIVLTNNSNFHPLVIGMVHSRFYELNETVAFHASFGMSGNFQSQSAGGSSVGFLLGPSVSLFRTMFFTPGLYFGNKTIVGGGYNVGETVPSTVTTVPLETSYRPGFGFAITFTKP